MNQRPENSAVSFFRQSGWMMMASTLGGVFLFAVHSVAPWMGRDEYGLFGTLLQWLNLMMIPALGLQTVFAQQTAAAASESGRRQLAGTVRAILGAATALWLVLASLAVVFRDSLIQGFHISNPAALWITVLFGLPQLWLPVFQGVLQGRQDFAAMGWIGISNGVMRLASVTVIVIGLGGRAAGAMVGALAGQTLAVCIAAHRAWPVVSGPGERFDVRAWLGRVIPLTIGLGVGQFMLAADMIVVRALFEPSRTGVYGGAGMLGRGLVMFTAPLVWVMFPKVVSAAGADSRKVLRLALAGTAGLGVAAALGVSGVCWATPWFLGTLKSGSLSIPFGLGAKLLGNEETIRALAQLAPWFLWCLLPLSLAIVLINDLLARRVYRAVPWLAVTAVGYLTALSVFHQSFERIIATLGASSLILVAVAAGFSRFRGPD